MKLTIESLKKQMAAAKYIAEDSVVVPIYLSLQLQKPLLIPAPPAWGKPK